MGVYIKGMKMPKTGRYFVAVDNTDGKDKTVIAIMSEFESGDKTRPLLAVHEIVPVPPHGDSIDRAALWVEINKICDRRDAGIITDLTCLQQILSAVRHAPTIIPAQGKGYILAPQEEYDGLKRKYVVLKSDTGECVENCFVLRPDKDKAAIAALLAYADATDNHVLAKDIRAWISTIPAEEGET